MTDVYALIANPLLDGSRIQLRQLSIGDATDLFEYASDEEVSKYTSWYSHRRLDDTHTYIRSALQKYRSKQPGDWGIIEKATNKLIGACGWVYIQEGHRRAEIGYVLSRRYWNQGYMSEAVRLVLQYGFDQLCINRIEARCMEGNAASERVMQKVGMLYEGTMRQQMVIKGAFHNMKLYALLRTDWRQLQSKPQQ